MYLALLYLFVPAFVANATPVLVKDMMFIKRWNTPICTRLFGAHKTYRGFFFGVSFGMFASLMQFGAIDVYPALKEITILHNTLNQSLLVGFLLSFGALAGDAVESFVKRRKKLPPGKALPFWDGVDYIIGAIIFISPVYPVTFLGVAFLMVVAPILSICANCFSYALGLKDVWY